MHATMCRERSSERVGRPVPRKRRGLWLLLLPLLPALLAVMLWGCDDTGGSATTTITTGADSGKPTHLEFQLGEEAVVGDVTVMVPALMLTAHPSRPQFPVEPGAGFSLVGNEVFCQAFVKVKNAGDGAVRVDPDDFTLDVPGAAPMDRARTGPAARSLLHGTSLDLILTYVVTEGTRPTLVYRPPWFNGSLSFSGQRGPAGAQ